MRKLPHLLAILFISLHYSSAVAESHCASGEDTFFNCKISKSGKILSVCGHLRAPQFLQYRFGHPQKTELVFPKAKKDSLSRFSLGRDYRPTAGTTTYELSFAIATYKYAVFATSHPLSEEPNSKFGKFGGVSITPGAGKEVELLCDGTPIDRLQSLEGHVERP